MLTTSAEARDLTELITARRNAGERRAAQENFTPAPGRPARAAREPGLLLTPKDGTRHVEGRAGEPRDGGHRVLGRDRRSGVDHELLALGDALFALGDGDLAFFHFRLLVMQHDAVVPQVRLLGLEQLAGAVKFFPAGLQ